MEFSSIFDSSAEFNKIKRQRQERFVCGRGGWGGERGDGNPSKVRLARP